MAARRRDLEIFEAAAPRWWDADGPVGALQLLNPYRAAYFLERLEKAGARSVLELGCGGGILSASLEPGPWRLVSQDLLEGPLRAARGVLSRAALARCDARRLPFRPRSFDAVVSSDFLEHAGDLEAVVSESARVLRPGGLFLYETISRTLLSFLVGKVVLEWTMRFIPVGTHRFRDFIRPAELHALMSRHGLRNIEIFGAVPQRGVVAALRDAYRRRPLAMRLDPDRLSGIYVGCGRLEAAA